ncbi:MAG TPA: efflux RND transporter periplasmic adaptor subunit [Acetobacteraceae bacterium]|jgi:multidrug efflux system membrane fusion protein|nr:efflux RND transporter periplasmic adaptor subunit [Acetobacteraceae bacterium]
MDALTREPVLAPPIRRTRRRMAALLCVLVTAVIATAIWRWPVAPPVDKAALQREANQVVPVVQAEAMRRDMPVWLDGLGTVQAFQTVTVKTMVDGPLTDVAFTEGQTVHVGDVLARIDPRVYRAALDNAVAKKALDEATLANARLDLARYQKLVVTNYATQQQADTAKATVAQTEALIRQDQAQIDTVQTQLSYTTITSPLDGKVGMRLMDKGNIVHAADSTGLVVITQLQPISVVFNLPQQTLTQVAATMAAAGSSGPEVLAYEQGSGTGRGRPLDQGTLTVLDNQIDPTTGTIKLKATFPNKAGTLWPGGFVGIRLRIDTVRNATVVPQAAVQRGPRGSFVYVVDPDSTAHRKDVTIGYEDELGSVVTSGIEPGNHVVVDGASRLTDGAKVSVVAPEREAPTGISRPAAPGTRGTGQSG